jgi:cytochrome b pre-mRNA-processing protein 3
MGLLQSLGLARSPGDVDGLYAAIVKQARMRDFYVACGVLDSAAGRFDMVALHAYVVLRRLKELGSARNGDLGQALFDRMFADLDQNLREMGVGDLRVGRQIKELAKSFYGRIKAYDDALAGDASVLDGALRRNAYVDAAPDEAQVALLGRYLRSAIAQSRTWTSDDIQRARIDFPAPLTQ